MKYRGYEIVGDGTFGMKKIIYPGRGGTIPEYLSGAYTKAKEAIQAIDHYLLVKEEADSKPIRVKKVKLTPREVENATSSEGGD